MLYCDYLRNAVPQNTVTYTVTSAQRALHFQVSILNQTFHSEFDTENYMDANRLGNELNSCRNELSHPDPQIWI